MAAMRVLWIDESPSSTFSQALGPMQPARRLLDLTRRELEILVWIGSGADNEEMARRAGTSKRTIETHVGHIYSKLALRNRSQAILYAIRHGLVSVGN